MKKDEKLPVSFTSGAETVSGTDKGSVYFKLTETADALLAVRPLFYPSFPHPQGVLMLGGRVRLQLKAGEFPVVPDEIKNKFGFPEMERRDGNKHMSVMFGIPVTCSTAMFHHIRAIIAENELVEKTVDGLLARIPKKLKLLSDREQLIAVYTNMLDDEVPNMIPGKVEHAFMVGPEIHKLSFNQKPIPVAVTPKLAL